LIRGGSEVQLLRDPPGQAPAQPAKPTRFAGGPRSDVCRNRFLRFRPIDNGAIAQLGERLVCNQKVAGSIPAGSTSFAAPPATDTRSALSASPCENVSWRERAVRLAASCAL